MRLLSSAFVILLVASTAFGVNKVITRTFTDGARANVYHEHSTEVVPGTPDRVRDGLIRVDGGKRRRDAFVVQVAPEPAAACDVVWIKSDMIMEVAPFDARMRLRFHNVALTEDVFYIAYSMRLEVHVDIVRKQESGRSVVTKTLFTEVASEVLPRMVKSIEFVRIVGDVFARVQMEGESNVMEVWQVSGDDPVQIQDASIIEQVLKAEGIGASVE